MDCSELRYQFCFQIVGALTCTHPPTYVKACVIFKMPQQAPSTMSNRFSKTEINKLADSLAKASRPGRLANVYNSSAFNPATSNYAFRVRRIKVFEPSSTTVQPE